MPVPRIRIGGVLIGLALSAVFCARAASAFSLSPDVLASLARLAATRAAASRVSPAAISADDKQRVPKPTPPPSGGSGDRHGHHDDADEDNDCFSNCLVGFGTSLVESPTPPPAPVPATALEAEASQWAVGSDGWLVAPAEVDSVGLWDAPAEPDQPRGETGRLPHGAHVVVVETHAMASGFWVRVRPFDAVEPIGWVPSSLLTWASAPSPAPPRMPKPDPTWGFRILLGGGGIGPTDLDLEYNDGGFRADAQYLRLLRHQWISGVGLDVRGFLGHPRWAYATATTLDDPHDSELWITELGIRAGQRYGDRHGFRFDWMLGPTLAVVDEHANVAVYDRVAPDTLVHVLDRRERLTRVAGGGELRANIGWATRSGDEWGLHVGAFMFAWEGRRERSLASDFIRSNIDGWDVSLSYSRFQ